MGCTAAKRLADGGEKTGPQEEEEWPAKRGDQGEVLVGWVHKTRRRGVWLWLVDREGMDPKEEDRWWLVGSALKPRERVAAAWGFGGDWTG